MNSRLKTLQRMTSFYKAVEMTQEAALDRAAAAVREVDVEIERHAALADRLKREGSDALQQGDGLTWRMDESQLEFTEWNAEALLGIRQRREDLMQTAAALFVESRVQSSQIESVLDGLHAKIDAEHARRQQGESDDRYLSRRRWLADRK